MAEIKEAKGIKPLKPPEPPVDPFPDLMWAWNGFWRLSNSRPAGFDGVLRIPLSETEAYCRFQNYDYAKRQDFLIFVERMDHAFMEHIAFLREQEETKQKLKSNEKKRPRRAR